MPDTTTPPVQRQHPANLALALSLAARGWYVFPCGEDKRPLTPHGFKDSTTDPAQIRTWWAAHPGALVGIACERSGFFALDIDNKNGANGYAEWDRLYDTYAEGQPVYIGPQQATPSGGAHVLFRLPEFVKIPNNAGKLAPGLDLRSAGYICTGSLPDGRGYTWLPEHGPETKLPDAPAWLLVLIENLGKKATPAPAAPARQPSQAPTGNGAHHLAAALAKAVPGTRNVTGFDLACQLRDDGLPESDAARVMAEYAACVPMPGDGYTERDALASLRSAYSAPPREPARRNGNGHHPAQAAQAEPPEPTPPDDWPHDEQPAEEAEAGQDTAPTLAFILECLQRDEYGDAELLAHLFKGRLCYDASNKNWYVFGGNYWQRDTVGRVKNLLATEIAAQYIAAAAQIRRIGGEDSEKTEKALLERAHRLRYISRTRNVLDFAASIPALATDGNQWDKADGILSVENGVVNLATGEFRKGKPSDFILAHAPTSWQGLNAPAPTWKRFLSDVFMGDGAMLAFVQRLFGYAITGQCSERIFPVLQGDGSNGKSTLLETLGAVLGSDITGAVSAEALMDSKNGGGDRPNPALYSLRGKRLAWASESKEGQRLDIGLVKLVTGGIDSITVRTLYQAQPVTFRPQFTLMLLTNHKPHIPADDLAAWDRVRLIEFAARFVDNPTENERKKDKDLPAKLLAEAPGILAWLVRGALAWRREGLNLPAKVTAATQAYCLEEDTLHQYVTERIYQGENCSIRGEPLYQDYCQWCKGYNLDPMNGTAFGRKMGKKFRKEAKSRGVIYYGISLMTEGS